jgi:hypothetical protein
VKQYIVLALVGALASCGGGGDGDASGYDVDAAFTRLYTQGASFPGLRGTSQGGVAITESHSWEPLASIAQTLAVLHTTTRIPADPAATPLPSKETLSYSINPWLLSTRQSDVGVEHYARDGLLPSNAAPGASGPVAHTTDLGATRTLRWSLAPSETAGLAWACLEWSLVSNGGSTYKECLKIDGQGRFSAARIEYHSLPVDVVLQ